MNNLTLKSLNVKDEICSAFSKLGFSYLSDVQEKTIPVLLNNKSVLVVSETGSGKTFSYLIPILNNIDFDDKSLEAIILLPTNILVDQVKKVISSFTSNLGYKDDFVKAIKSKNDFSKSFPKIVVTTTSLYNQIFSHYPTNNLKNVIIDEGDMLIFDGFSEVLNLLKKQIDKKIVSIFSASIKKQDITRIKSALKISTVIEVSCKITSYNVSHVLVDYFPLNKEDALVLLLNQKDKYLKTIVFFKTIEELNKISSYLKDKKLKFLLVHGELDKRAIKKTLNDFDKASSSILLASDYLSRGIDCKDVDLIISYSLPSDLDYYFHRAGRTGRFFNSGLSYILVNKDDEKDLKAIKSLNKRGISFSLVKLSKNGIKDLPTSYIFKNLGKKDQSNDQLQKKIRHAVNKTKSKKVKPNYKKKVSKAVSRVKEKHRMKVVRTNIAKSGGNVKDFHVDH